MQEVSVNRLLAMDKSLRARLSQLEKIKEASAKEVHWLHEDKKIEKPVYDAKKVDSKCVAINKALFDIDHLIKESNARTMVKVNLNYDSLVSEVE